MAYNRFGSICQPCCDSSPLCLTTIRVSACAFVGLPGAKVELVKNGEVLYVGTTNSNGDVAFDIGSGSTFDIIVTSNQIRLSNMTYLGITLSCGGLQSVNLPSSSFDYVCPPMRCPIPTKRNLTLTDSNAGSCIITYNGSSWFGTIPNYNYLGQNPPCSPTCEPKETDLHYSLSNAAQLLLTYNKNVFFNCPGNYGGSTTVGGIPLSPTFSSCPTSFFISYFINGNSDGCGLYHGSPTTITIVE